MNHLYPIAYVLRYFGEFSNDKLLLHKWRFYLIKYNVQFNLS